MSLIEPTTEQRKPATISRKEARAIEAMVWEGMQRDDAARAAGMLPKSLYNALRKASVKQAYLREIEVLRTSGKARRIHRLEELSLQDDNKQAAINAIRALDQLEDDVSLSRRTGFNASPGLVVNIINAGGEAKAVIDASQPIDNTAD